MKLHRFLDICGYLGNLLSPRFNILRVINLKRIAQNMEGIMIKMLVEHQI